MEARISEFPDENLNVLLDEIRDIMDRHEADAYYDYAEALANHLRDWFAEYFKTKDARLHKMLG